MKVLPEEKNLVLEGGLQEWRTIILQEKRKDTIRITAHQEKEGTTTKVRRGDLTKNGSAETPMKAPRGDPEDSLIRIKVLLGSAKMIPEKLGDERIPIPT